MSTQSTVLNESQYSFKTRFEDGIGTNPEELIGAAHAGCFTMKLSFLLGAEGFTPDLLETEAGVTFEDGSVSNINLSVVGKVAGISEAQFTEIAQKAKVECPISQLLNTTITLDIKLAE